MMTPENQAEPSEPREPQFIIEHEGKLFMTIQVVEIEAVGNETVVRAQFDNAVDSKMELRAVLVDTGGEGPISVKGISVGGNPPNQ